MTDFSYHRETRRPLYQQAFTSFSGSTFSGLVPPPAPVVVPITITTLALAVPFNGVPYAFQVQAIGGTGARTWTIVSGALPAGLSMSTGGLITGTASAVGEYLVTVRVVDSVGRSDMRAYTLIVVDPVVPEIPNHCEIALARLIASYREQPNVEALVCIYAFQVQAVEQLLTEIRFYRGIENGFGVRLDWIGELLRLPRNGLTDAAYRPLLRARARAVSAPNTLDSAVMVLGVALNGTTTYHLEQHFAATYLQWIDGDTDAVVGRIIARGVLDHCRPRGVHRVLWHQDASTRPLFGWLTTPDAVGWAGVDPTTAHWAEAH